MVYQVDEAALLAGIRLTQRANAIAAALTPLVAVPLAYLVIYVANGTPGTFSAFLGDVFRVWHLGVVASLVLAYLAYILAYRVRRRAEEVIADTEDPFQETLVEADPSGLTVTAEASTRLTWEALERSWEGGSMFVLKFSLPDRHLLVPKEELGAREEEWLRSML